EYTGTAGSGALSAAWSLRPLPAHFRNRVFQSSSTYDGQDHTAVSAGNPGQPTGWRICIMGRTAWRAGPPGSDGSGAGCRSKFCAGSDVFNRRQIQQLPATELCRTLGCTTGTGTDCAGEAGITSLARILWVISCPDGNAA